MRAEALPCPIASRRREPRRRRRRAPGAAERRARAHARLARSALHGLLVVALLWVLLRPLAVVVGLVWGLSLLSRVMSQLVEPALRDHWVRREVERRLEDRVPRERRQAAGRHRAHLEELSSQVAEEIQSPVQAAKRLVRQMGEDPRHPDNLACAGVALDELGRVEDSISRLLARARAAELQLTRLDPAQLLREVAELARPAVERRGVRLRTGCRAQAPLWADAQKLRAVLGDAVACGLAVLEQAPPARPRLELEAGENLAGTEVWLRLRSNGLEPGPREREGLLRGCGGTPALAEARRVVEAHGGSLELGGAPGGGLEVLVVLPRPSRSDP